MGKRNTATRAAVVLAVTAVVALGAGCSSGSKVSRTTPISLPTVSTSAPPTGPLPSGVISSISVDSGPIIMNAAFGSIWLPAHRTTSVDRIDPRTDRVVAQIDVGQESCSPAFATPTQLIVSACNDGAVSTLIDPHTNQVVGSIPGFVSDYAYGSGWFTDISYDVLQRVDLRSRHRVTVAKIWVGGLVHALGKEWDAEFSGNDGAWMGGIAEIDPRSNRVVRTLRLPNPGLYANLVYAFGALWVQGGGKPYFFRIDPVTGSVKRFAIPNYAPNKDGEGGDIEAGPTSLWMQMSPSAIGRFDPRTGKLQNRYPADAAGGSSWPLEAFGSLWVSNFDSDTVWRDRLAR